MGPMNRQRDSRWPIVLVVCGVTLFAAPAAAAPQVSAPAPTRSVEAERNLAKIRDVRARMARDRAAREGVALADARARVVQDAPPTGDLPPDQKEKQAAEQQAADEQAAEQQAAAEAARKEEMQKKLEALRESARTSTRNSEGGQPPAGQPRPDFAGPPTQDELARRAGAARGGDYVGPPTQEELSRGRRPTDFVGPPTTEELDRIEAARRTRGDYTGPPTTEELDREDAARRTAAAKPAPPAAPPTDEPPADGRTEWFAFVDAQWEDVIKAFAKRIGKPLLDEGDIPVSGTLTYYNVNRRFTPQEAIDELNFLLNEQGARFVEKENFIEVIPLNEMDQHVPLDRIYTSREAFEEARLRDMDYAILYHTVTRRKAQDYVDMFASSVPDLSMPVTVARTNQIKMRAIVQDIRRFLALIDKVDLGEFDPRETRFFKIKTNVAEIERMVQRMFDLSGPQPRRWDPQRRQWIEPQGGETESSVRMFADERTNHLIVKATADDMKKIEAFINEMDKLPDIGEFKTVVIPVENGSAADIANLLNQIFQQEQGQSQLTALQRARMAAQQRGGRQVQQPQANVGAVAPEDLLSESLFEKAKKTIRMVADERTNSLIVYANEDGVKRVEEMLQTIDKPLPSNFRTFELANAEVDQIIEPLNQMVQSLRGAPVGRGVVARGGATLVPDARKNVIHVLAEREDLKKVEEFIALLDVPIPEGQKHVVELRNLIPSQIIPALTAVVSDAQAAAPIRNIRRGGRVAPGGPVATDKAQFIPLDEARMLIVICDDEQWVEIEETIQLYDGRALSDTPVFRSFEVREGDARQIAGLLAGFFGQYTHPTLGRSQVSIDAVGRTIYVQGVKPAIEEIESLIAQLDVPPDANPLVIFPLEFADANSVATLAQPLLTADGGAGGPFRPGRGGGVSAGGNSVQPDTLTNALIIRADERTTARITAFATELDQKAGAQQPERRYFDIKNAPAREVAAAIQSIYQAGGGRGGGRFGGAATGGRVTAIPAGSQLVVEAPKEKLAEIEELVRTLDAAPGGDLVIKTLSLPGVEVAGVAQRLNNALREKAQRAGAVVRAEADPASETVVLTCSQELLPDAEGLLVEWKALLAEVTVETQFRQLKFAAAEPSAQMLREMTQNLLRSGVRGAAALQIQPDARTNRLIISGPQTAVRKALLLVNEIDVEAQDVALASSMTIETRKLPGMDVNNLANQLNPIFQNRPQRPDKGRITFTGDRLTELLIISAPKDAIREIDELIAKFTTETEELKVEPKTYTLAHADANYVTEQLKAVLLPRIQKTSGDVVAGRINIIPEVRSNVVTVSAPRFVLPEIEAIVQQLDADIPEIVPVTIDLTYVDPNQVKGMLDQMYPRSSGRGGASMQDVSVSVSANKLVVRAPAKKMEEIRALIRQIDAEAEGMEFKAYTLKVLDAQQTAFGVQMALQQLVGTSKPGLKPGAFAEPTTNTLIVMAPAEQLPFIDGLITKLEMTSLPTSEPRTYQMLNARADISAPDIEKMLKAKVAEKEGLKRKDAVQTAVVAEARTNRLVVFAPKEYHTLVDELVKMIDADVDTGEIVRIRTLELSDATQVANTLREIVQGGVGPRGAAGGGGRQVKIVPDAGSNSLLLSGLPKDVAHVEQLIDPLEERGSTVPKVQTFSLEYATTARVQETLETMFPSGRNQAENVAVSVDSFYNRVTVIAGARKMRQVEEVITRLDAAPQSGEKGTRVTKYVDIFRGDPYDIAYEVQDQFPDPDEGGPKIDAPLFGEYVTVRCRPSEFEEILAAIREVEARQKVEIKTRRLALRGDQERMIALLRLQYPDLVVQTADRPAELPSLVEPLYAPGEEHPFDRKQREGRDGARGNDRRGRPERSTDGAAAPRPAAPVTRGVAVQPMPEDAASFELAADAGNAFTAKLDDDLFAMQAADMSRALRAPVRRPASPKGAAAPQRPALQPPARTLAELMNEPPPSAATPGRSIRLVADDAAPARGVAPTRAFGAPQALLDDLAPQLVQATPGSAPARPAAEPAGPAVRRTPAAPQPPAATEDDKPAGPRAVGASPAETPKKEPVTFRQLADGRWIISGPETAVEDIEDAISEIEEDLEAGEVIRIFELKYGDVNSAAQILDKMFNDQQVLRMAQQLQQPQPQQQGRQRGQQGEEQNPQQQMMEQMRQMMGMGQAGRQTGGRAGQGGPRLRMATDPGHNRLIIKCDQTDLPEIKQLLRDLDIPPGEVDIRVIALKNLEAEETANNIKQVLGINRAQGARQNPFGRGGNPQQQQLMQILQEQMVVNFGGGEAGGAKIESVEIVPNAITNSLLISAPPDVMEIIEKTISDLEQLEGRDIVGIHQYELEKAKVNDVLPLLESVFSAVSGAGGGAPVRGSRGGSKPGSVGPVSISGDPRSNTLIFTCEAKDVALVREQIGLLDIEGNIREVETYICNFGDATEIATTVAELFAEGGGARGRAGAEASGGSDVRITAHAATNTVLVRGPRDQRDLIFKEVQKQDDLSRRDVQEIPVVYADPEKLAQKLSALFSNATVAAPGADGPGPGGGRRGPRSAAAGGGTNVLIMGDKDAKKLLVRAPETTLQEIVALVKVLDQASKMLELKRFELQYAKADAVVATLEDAMTKYITVARATGGSTEFDPFTVIPDARTNSITVVGSPQTFVFVQAALATIDVETPADRQKQFRIFVLQEADALIVADRINAFAQGGESVAAAAQPAGGPGGRRPPGGAGGGTPGTGNTIDVTASADTGTNTLFLTGSADDIARIEQAIILPMENASQRIVARIPVSKISPTALYSQIGPMLQTASADGVQGGPQITPNDAGKSLVVYGTQAQVRKVEQLVEKFDAEDLAAPAVKIIRVPYGQRASELAAVIERVVNDGERIFAEARGMPARQITIGADDASGTLLVNGDASLQATVEAVVGQISDGAGNVVTRVIDLGNLTSDDAIQVITDIQNRRSGGSSSGSRSGGGFTPGGSGGSTPRITPGNRPRNTPRTTPRTNQPIRGRRDGVRPSGDMPTRPPGRVQSAPVGGLFVGFVPGELIIGGGAMSTLVDELFDDAAKSAPGHDNAEAQLNDAQRHDRNARIVREFAQSLHDPRRTAASQPGAHSRPAAPLQAGRPASPPATTTPTGRAFRRDLNIEDDEPRAAARPAAPRPEQRVAQATPPPDAPAARPPARRPAAEPAQQPPANPLQPAEGAPQEPDEGVITSVSGTLRGDVLATPVDSGKIIITGDERDVEFIIKMLRLMESSAEKPTLRVFPLETAKATALAPLLEQIMQASIEQLVGTPRRSDRVSIVAEAKSNSLIVSASESNMGMIEELILQLDQPGVGGGGQPKLVPLRHIRAAEAVQLLQPLLQRLSTQREVPSDVQPEVTAVSRTNSLLIAGTPADIAEIEELVAAIDIEIPPEDDFTTGHMAIVSLKNGLAEPLAETLNELVEAEKAAAAAGAGGSGASATAGPLVRKLLITRPDGTELPALNLDKPIKILPEKATNSLIIYSTPQNNEALREIAGVFDTLPQGEEVDVRSFALQHAQAEQVKTLLSEMFEQAKKALVRPANLGASGTEQGVYPPIPPNLAGKGLPYNVTISSDARSNTVFVVGRRDAVLLAAGMIEQMDKPGAELGFRSFVLRLKNMQASTLAEKLNEMLEQRGELLGGDGSGRDKAVIVPDERSNALIILAAADVYEMISGLAQQIDDAASYKIVDTRYRRLKYADSAKLQSMLQELFTKKKEAETETSSEVKDTLSILADGRSNSLVMTGTRDYLDEAEVLIGQLDKAFDPTVQFRLRAVRLNSASNIATLLTDMVEKSRSARAGGEAGASGTPIHIAADPISNNLLLAASAEDMLQLDRWIDVLDRPAEPGRAVRVIPLRRGNAEEIANNMKELYQGSGGGAGGAGAGADLSVTFDAATKSVIAIGPPAIVKDIESMIGQLDQTDPKANAVIRIFKLTQADAEDAGALLQNLLEGRGGSVGGGAAGGGGGGGQQDEAARQVMLVFQKEHPEIGRETLRALRSEISVTAVIRTNSLVVTAPADSMALMESLIEAIDVPPDAVKYRVFQLRNADAEEMVTLLEKLFQTGEQGGARGAAGAAGQERVLDVAGGGRQEVRFTSDVRTNSVIAAGTTGYLQLVEDVILDLDTKPIDEVATFAMQPGNTLATSIAETLTQVSDAERARLNELGEQISPQRKLERQFSAIANEDSNIVIMTADRRFESEVRRLARELDRPPPQVSIEVQIIEVSMDSSLDLGVEFAFQDLQFAKAGPNDTTSFDYVGGTDLGASGGTLGGFTFTITGADFNFLLRTLQSEGNLNVLSRPQIVAMDNQEASFEIVNDVPFVNSTSTSVAGQVTTSVDRTEVGIILTVTPHINPDGFVRMEIRQEVSDIADSSIAVGPGVTAPIFFRRVAETTVTVKDTETVVLGGLIQTRDSRSETKVPILGDIPGIGALFRNQNEESRRTELLIVLTPRVIRTVEDYHNLSVMERDNMRGLPAEYLTSPLMNTLQVRPDEPLPAGPTALPLRQAAPADALPAEEHDADSYGPPRPGNAPRIDPATDPNSYDVPITRRQRR